MAAGTRRRARLSELTPPGCDVAEQFVAARLLVADRDPASREPVIGIAHEALLSHWPRLGDWLEQDRRWIGQLQHLASAARGWDDSGRPDGELYRGSRLEAAIEALPERHAELTDVELAFVEAGRAARDATLLREQRSARRLRRLLAAVAGALVLTLIAGAVAVVQRGRSRESARAAQAAETQAVVAADEARAAEERALTAADEARAAEERALTAADEATAARQEAEIEALVGRIGSLRSTQRDTAALLAVEAFKLADTPRTRSALLSTFTQDQGFLDSHRLPVENDLYFGIVLPDGERALVTTRDHRLRPYDLDTGKLGEPWQPMSASELRFTDVLTSSLDGRLLAHIADNENVDRDPGGHHRRFRRRPGRNCSSRRSRSPCRSAQAR